MKKKNFFTRLLKTKFKCHPIQPFRELPCYRKPLTCIHFYLPLRFFIVKINKKLKRLSVLISIIKHFSDFFGADRAFK